jgi:phosphoribosylanthranilate isomerase
LNAGNVAAALEAVRPYAVDVESGVRSVKGQKDPAKVAALLEGVSSEDRQ